jgi:hypothetical protein
MVIKSLSITTKILSILGILSMLAIISTFIWIMTGPRSLENITPYIEKRLNSLSSQVQIKIAESYIRWDGIERAFTIDVTDVDILNDTNDSIASFPKVSFAFNMLRFFKGQFLSSDLTLTNPTFYINSSQKTLYVTPEGNTDFGKMIADKLTAELKSNSFSFPVSSIHLKDAVVFLNNGYSEFAWQVKNGYAKVDSFKGKNKIISEFNINFGSDITYFGSEVSYESDGTTDTKIKFTDLPSYVITDMFPDVAFLQKLNLRASGDIDLLLSSAGEISQVQFDFSDVHGDATVTELLDKKMQITLMQVQGSLYENFTAMAVNKMTANINGINVSADGVIKNHAAFPEILPEFKVNVSVKDIDVDKVADYWPEMLSPANRTWVTTNIKGGKVTSATGKFNFTPDDLEKIKQWHIQSEKDPASITESPLSDEAINATINVEGTNVHYHEDYPDIRDVSGIVKFTGNAMYVEADKGKILNSNISSASLAMENMWLHHIALDIKGDFIGSAEDGISFLKAAMTHEKPNTNLENIYKTTGIAQGKIAVFIPLESNLTYKDIKLDIESQFSKTTVPELIKGNSISDADFTLSVKNYLVDITGKGTINGAQLDFTFNKDFDPEKEEITNYKIAGEVSAKYFADLDMASIPFISGPFNVDVTMQEKPDGTTVSGTADITNSDVAIKQISFTKAAGVAGKITFDAEQKEKNINVKSFTAEGTDFAANGNFTLADSNLTSLNLDKAKLGNSDLKLNYSTDDKSSKIDAKGKGLDISQAAFGEFLKQGKEGPKALEIKVALDNLHMKNGEVLQGFRLNANCAANLCKSASGSGKFTTKGGVTLSLKPVKDKSLLVITSDNAGALINALNISKNINNGSLRVESTFATIGTSKVAQGTIIMRDFKAIKTPLLGKVLTVASFQGIGDILNNEGITFKKFEAPFTLADGIITVNDAKSSGASIGLTASGTIDTGKGEIDMKGAIVPAAAINKVLGNIPLVGGILVGKKNEGVFATRYSLKGTYDDAEVSVNPISIITPGILRNIFDIGG